MFIIPRQTIEIVPCYIARIDEDHAKENHWNIMMDFLTLPMLTLEYSGKTG